MISIKYVNVIEGMSFCRPRPVDAMMQLLYSADLGKSQGR